MFHILQNGTIHCIACSLTSSEWAALQCILLHIGCCLFCRALAVYQVQRVLTKICCYCCCCCTTISAFVRWKCAHGPWCIIVLYKLCNVLIYVLLFNVQYVMHTLQRGLCAACDKEYDCFITKLRLPILSLHQYVQLQVQMFAHVQVPAQWTLSQEKSSGVIILVIFGPNKLAKPRRWNNPVSFGSKKMWAQFLCVLNLTISGKSFVDPSLPKEIYHGSYIWIMAVVLLGLYAQG